MSKKILILVV